MISGAQLGEKSTRGRREIAILHPHKHPGDGSGVLVLCLGQCLSVGSCGREFGGMALRTLIFVKAIGRG